MKKRTTGLMLALAICLGCLAGCNDAAPVATSLAPFETGNLAPSSESGEDVRAGDSQQQNHGDNGLLAIQTNANGLVELKVNPAYYTTPRDVNENAGTIGYYELVYNDGNGNEKSYGQVNESYIEMREHNGQLYYTSGDSEIYLFDKDTGENSLWASKAGYSLGGSAWCSDDEYLYLGLYVQDGTGNSKDCSIARVRWADGSVEELPNTDNYVLQGASANTLFVSDWTLPTLTLSALDIGTGEIKLVRDLPDGFDGVILEGVYYNAKLENGNVVLHGENLLTGETGSLALGIQAEDTMVTGYNDERVWLYAFVDDVMKDIGVDVKTGDVKEVLQQQ